MRKWMVVLVAAGGLGCPHDGDTGDDGHDIVELQVALADGAALDVLQGTVMVRAPLVYGECLTGFYAERQDLTSQGVRGEEIFAAWEARLCGDAPRQASCDVLDLDQNLELPALTIDYEVHDLVENNWLAFGPVPTPHLAACDAEMLVPGDAQLQGYDDNGELLWDTKTFVPAKASSGQGEAIRFNVGEP